MILKIKGVVNKMPIGKKDTELSPEERRIMNQLNTSSMQQLDPYAISITTNLYRIAQGLKLKMERKVLSQYHLSWTAFSLLYDLWVLGAMETKNLAKSSGITKATVSNVTNTLEKKEFCFRKVDKRDRRTVYVMITEKGKKAMEEMYPKFHKGEVEIVSSLNLEEQKNISELLRRIIRTNNF
ncbi:MarR family transcriptional regulator [Bacillus safensis]|uniref:MarR family transcriptional regulator n=2 Tax=Bacillus safensis TaxID=561879 RepID=UPI00399CC99A